MKIKAITALFREVQMPPGQLCTLVGGSLGALMLFTVAIAYANEGGEKSQEYKTLGWMNRADADKDGIIFGQDMEAARRTPCNHFDRDGDGVVSEIAIPARMQKSIDRATQQMVRSFDADRGGKITKDEFNRITRERSGWLDLNDDEDELPRFARRTLR